MLLVLILTFLLAPLSPFFLVLALLAFASGWLRIRTST